MMKAQIKVTGNLIVEVEGDTQLELFKELSSAQEVFSNVECGVCGDKALKYVVREDDKDHEYVELHCTKVGCRARLPFGQSSKPKGSLYPKVRWNSLSDKIGPSGSSEQDKRKDEKEFADKHGGFLPHGGWYKYKHSPSDNK